MDVLVIGAGMGGLTCAAVLARAGLRVVVLEAQTYPGGCASTWFHRGYRFDTGATLAGGFNAGGPMDLVGRACGVDWPVQPADLALTVHLPEQPPIERWCDTRWHDERLRAFGADAEPFWHWQEARADALWDLALRLPPWPPGTGDDLRALLRAARPWLSSHGRQALSPAFALDATRPLAARHVRALRNDTLRRFLDGQLLISAQCDTTRANALYAAAALDLPRRGVAHVRGGIGALAGSLVEAVRRAGGEVRYRARATALTRHAEGWVVHTSDGELRAHTLIANLTPWNLRALLADTAPARLKRLPDQPPGWGACVIHAGVDARVLDGLRGSHHQIIAREPLGECNSVFVSISPPDDAARAPAARRAVTISTHTALTPWRQARASGEAAYHARKSEYAARMLETAERVFGGLRAGSDVLLTGTPLTWQHYTGRQDGWVGGFAQTSLLGAFSPRVVPGLWLVGDSIFPGQSIAACALGGLGVARRILAERD